MATLTENSVVVRLDDVVSCDLAGGAALLDLRSSTYYSLNGPGAKVWELIASPTTVGAIRDAFTAQYEVAADQCLRDIMGVVTDFDQAGLVKILDESAG